MPRKRSAAGNGSGSRQVTIPPALSERIDKVLDKGEYRTIAELARDAIRKLLAELEVKDNCQR